MAKKTALKREGVLNLKERATSPSTVVVRITKIAKNHKKASYVDKEFGFGQCPTHNYLFGCRWATNSIFIRHRFPIFYFEKRMQRQPTAQTHIKQQSGTGIDGHTFDFDGIAYISN